MFITQLMILIMHTLHTSANKLVDVTKYWINNKSIKIQQSVCQHFVQRQTWGVKPSARQTHHVQQCAGNVFWSNLCVNRHCVLRAWIQTTSSSNESSDLILYSQTMRQSHSFSWYHGNAAQLKYSVHGVSKNVNPSTAVMTFHDTVIISVRNIPAKI